MSSPYRHPSRGDGYERYLAGMDASMKQKVAMTAAFVLCRGKALDMGMGSGAGSFALAQLYPGLQVVGVDVDPNMVSRASAKYATENLSFVVGDIAAPIVEEGSVDAIFDSSVLHHVTTFGGYEYSRAANALAVQVRELALAGVLVVRDFVAPEDEPVLLDVPTDDGDASNDPKTMSTAKLLERFATEFRPRSTSPGFPLTPQESHADAPPPRRGFARYRLSLRHATEFLLRKDYRTDWEAEVLEEYTYFTQGEFERTLSSLGLRLLASTPIWNPWIIAHRYQGKADLFREATGTALGFPPTNFLIAGEKVEAEGGVRFEADRAEAEGYLEASHYRNVANGRIFDLVQRRGEAVDVVPFFEEAGALFVLARLGYPRPILSLAPRHAGAIDGARPAEYVTEPLSVVRTDRPLGQAVEDFLAEAAHLGPSAVNELFEGSTYYPSPGGLQEEVRTVFVRVSPTYVEARTGQRSGFSTSGRVRAVEATELLRAAQVGALPSARLEALVYELLDRLGRARGAWIGAELPRENATSPVSVRTMDELTSRPRRRAFEPTHESANFLSLEAHHFRELDCDGHEVHRRLLESVRPSGLSSSTLAILPVAFVNGEAFAGVDDDDLPAAQSFGGSSSLLVAPAWRLPRDVTTHRRAMAFGRQRFETEYGVELSQVVPLGGRYHPSPGVTPEAVFPFAGIVKSVRSGERALTFTPLRELATRMHALKDGHLRVLALRAAHAVG